MHACVVVPNESPEYIEVDELYGHFFLENKQKKNRATKRFMCVWKKMYVCWRGERMEGEAEAAIGERAHRSLSWFRTKARDTQHTIRDHQYP